MVRSVAKISALGGVGAILLSACTPLVAGIEVADDATNPLCAEAMVAMPEEVAGHKRRETDTQSTAAWGDPAAVIYRCGVEPPGPTTEHCVGVNGVDWITIEEGNNWRLITYGRDPASEIVFAADRSASSSVMVDISTAVQRIPATGGCTTTDLETVEPIPPATSGEVTLPPATAND